MSPKDSVSSDKGGGSGAFTPARIAVLVLAVAVVVFIFENTREVRIRLLVPEVTMPLYMALLAVAVIGAVCGGYAVGRRRR
ncbi:LapA family protein [Streptomyces sp. NPDC046939]|uniref:LapA family protein n=1 Tax=Streptomyces sp. NPDC046939 TaxID=3155376 RepID=UPI0033EB0C5B